MRGRIITRQAEFNFLPFAFQMVEPVSQSFNLYCSFKEEISIMGSTRLNLSLCNKFDVKCICKVSVFNDLSYYMSIRVQTKYILRENSTSQVPKMNNPPALYSQREARTTTTTEMYLSRNWEMGPQQQFLILDYINNDKPSRMIQSIRDKPISFQSYYIVAFPLCCRGGLWLRRHFST